VQNDDANFPKDWSDAGGHLGSRGSQLLVGHVGPSPPHPARGPGSLVRKQYSTVQSMLSIALPYCPDNRLDVPSRGRFIKCLTPTTPERT
jgi:hypothetical protein